MFYSFQTILSSASDSIISVGLDFTRAGHIHCKQGALGEWKLCWIQIKKKQLYLVGSDGTWQQDTDLRKVTNISMGESVVEMIKTTLVRDRQEREEAVEKRRKLDPIEQSLNGAAQGFSNFSLI